MHPLFEADVYYRMVDDYKGTKVHSKISWYLKNMVWKRSVLVLPQDYQPDLFLGLCLVEGEKVPDDFRVVNGNNLTSFLEDNKDTDYILTLHIPE